MIVEKVQKYLLFWILSLTFSPGIPAFPPLVTREVMRPDEVVHFIPTLSKSIQSFSDTVATTGQKERLNKHLEEIYRCYLSNEITWQYFRPIFNWYTVLQYLAHKGNEIQLKQHIELFDEYILVEQRKTMLLKEKDLSQEQQDEIAKMEERSLQLRAELGWIILKQKSWWKRLKPWQRNVLKASAVIGLLAGGGIGLRMYNKKSAHQTPPPEQNRNNTPRTPEAPASGPSNPPQPPTAPTLTTQEEAERMWERWRAFRDDLLFKDVLYGDKIEEYEQMIQDQIKGSESIVSSINKSIEHIKKQIIRAYLRLKQFGIMCEKFGFLKWRTDSTLGLYKFFVENNGGYTEKLEAFFKDAKKMLKEAWAHNKWNNVKSTSQLWKDFLVIHGGYLFNKGFTWKFHGRIWKDWLCNDDNAEWKESAAKVAYDTDYCKGLDDPQVIDDLLKQYNEKLKAIPFR